jgi:hypothetical protein
VAILFGYNSTTAITNGSLTLKYGVKCIGACDSALLTDIFRVVKMIVNDITGDRLVTEPASDKYRSGWDVIFAKKEEKPLTSCASHQDGDCSHKQCPQLRDNEPKASGRSCPLWEDIDND